MNWAFKIYLSRNNPSKRNPKLKMKTSLEVLNIICPPQASNNFNNVFTRHRSHSTYLETTYQPFMIYKNDLDECLTYIKLLFNLSNFRTLFCRLTDLHLHFNSVLDKMVPKLLENYNSFKAWTYELANSCIKEHINPTTH